MREAGQVEGGREGGWGGQVRDGRSEEGGRKESRWGRHKVERRGKK